jgi:hypothetical protein
MGLAVLISGVGGSHCPLLAQPDTAQAADSYPAQPTVEAALGTYLRVLQNRVKDPSLGIYSAATRELLRGRPVSDAQQRAEFAAIQRVQDGRLVREEGIRAVISFPASRQVPPYFFRRESGGWTIDLATASRVIGFDQSNEWYVRNPDNEFAFGL